MSRALRIMVQFTASAVLAAGWDTPPHGTITKAALESLPAPIRAKFGAEQPKLIEWYSIIPDRYVELEQHGFKRVGPGPSTLEELSRYCRRPDGQAVHSATFNREEDLDSLIFLVERMLTHLKEKQVREAAIYAGVMAHWIEDSLSPPHAVPAEDLAALGPGLPNLHRTLEHSAPAFTIPRRTAPKPGGTLLQGLQWILDRVYDGAERNRKALPDMVRTVRENGVEAVERYRGRSAREAAEILADAWLLLLADR